MPSHRDTPLSRRAFCTLMGAGLTSVPERSKRVGDPCCSPNLAIVAETVLPVSGPPIPNGVVLMSGGKITAVGAGLSIPSGAKVLRANTPCRA